jgi:predicted GNAT family N-acyltransferase
MMMPGISFRQATLEEIYELRFAVLRPGQAVEKVHFAGDDAAAPATYHFGAFAGERNVACLTLLVGEWEGERAYQLRGMAVAGEFRSQGVGARLMQEAEWTVIKQTDVRLWWCNARVGALRFYQRNGWQAVSEVFHIPGVGDHRKMVRRLGLLSG